MSGPEDLRRFLNDARLDRDNPWPGLASYDEASHEFFSGRSVETAELLRRILDEQVTVLFGKSGLGKTSLLKAGVFPRLRDRDLLPVIIRMQIRTGSEPLIEQVRLALFDELRIRDVDHQPAAKGETIWEYLHTIGREFWTRHNHLVRPVLVFDQFEELFTLGRSAPEEVEAFREDLADLAENRIPADLARRFEENSALDAKLNLQAMPYKVVISLREDFLADLESWRVTMPSLRRNRMRLLPLGPRQALEVVYNERTEHLVSEPLARKIVAFLSSSQPKDDEAQDELSEATVDPALLSLFCCGVNEHRQHDGKPRIDQALLEGGKRNIVADFYKSSIGDQPNRVRQFIEEELITEHGYRNSYSVEDAVSHGAVTTAALDTLVNRHLLRYEHHLGIERVELTHDLLTGAVLNERENRRLAERLSKEHRQRLRVGGLVALLVLSGLVFTILAVRASRVEQLARAEREASSRELAALAGPITDLDPELAVALGLEALERADTTEARSSLLDSARYTWPSAALATEQLGDVPTAIALSGDGSRLAVLAGGKFVTLWDVSSRQPVKLWKEPVAVPNASSVAVSPDTRLIAVAGRTSITLLDAQSGNLQRQLPPQPEIDDRHVVFSPDGQWLVSTQDEKTLQLVQYAQPTAPTTMVPAGDAIAFAVVSGTRIIIVTDQLAAFAIDRQPNGSWKRTPFDLSSCMRPQSVSPGSQFLSATWRASCLFETTNTKEIGQSSADWAIEDIIWSPGGHATAQLMAQRDQSQDSSSKPLNIVVGRYPAGGFTSWIKGAHFDTAVNEKSRLITVDESGARLAMIDQDEHKLVRIYSLAGHKLFVSRFDRNLFAASPDGSWIATTRAAPNEAVPTIDVIPLKQAFAPNQLLTASTRINPGLVPIELRAAANSVIAALPGTPETAAVFDATTGKRRYEPIVGRVEPLGASGDLLQAWTAERSVVRVLRTRDGSTVKAWERDSTPGGRLVTRFSDRRTALAVLRWLGSEDGRIEVTVYTINGETLTPAGRLIAPRGSAIASSLYRAIPSDDGKAMLDRAMHTSWPFGKDADSPTTPAAVEMPVVKDAVSPGGRFEVQSEPSQRNSPGSLIVLERDKKMVVKRFSPGDFRFSNDDHWVVVWGAEGLQALDLTTSHVAFKLNHTDVSSVGFLAQNTMLQVQVSDGAILVPLQLSLTQCFAQWLAPRALSADERAKYGVPAREAAPLACDAK